MANNSPEQGSEEAHSTSLELPSAPLVIAAGAGESGENVNEDRRGRPSADPGYPSSAPATGTNNSKDSQENQIHSQATETKLERHTADSQEYSRPVTSDVTEATLKDTKQISPDPSAVAQSLLREQITELSNQVSQLNAKLVGSYERIADLEDVVHEHSGTVKALRAKNQTLELEAAQHTEALQGGMLVERENVQAELQRLTQRVLDESAQRTKTEASLSSINKELDELSASLFDEANKMVASEKLQRIKAERKQSNVEEAMKDVQDAMKGLQVQLSDLGSALEATEKERDDLRSRWLVTMGERASQSDLARSAPVNALTFSDGDTITPANLSATSVHSLRASTTTPRTSFSYSAALPSILPPRLSNEALPYAEWIGFIKHLRKSRMEALDRPPPIPYGESYYQAAVVMGGHSQGRYQPTIPQLSAQDLLADILPLSYHLNQPFLKRCVEEDSDPTLRLDLAPGLNFMSRRTMQTSILEGNLMIEPAWGEGVDYEKCALCGTSLERWTGCRTPSTSLTSPANSATNAVRKMLGSSSWGFPALKPKKSSVSITTSHSPTSSVASVQSSQGIISTGPSTPNATGGVFSFPTSPTPSSNTMDPVTIHTFRSTDTSSNRYPLCPSYCLGRIRAVCDFWTYVRNVEKGLLLEEGFRFAGGQSSGSHVSHGTGNVSQSSFGLVYDTPKQASQEIEDNIAVSESEAIPHDQPSPTHTIKELSGEGEALQIDVLPAEGTNHASASVEESVNVSQLPTAAESASPVQLESKMSESVDEQPTSVLPSQTPILGGAAPPLPKRSAARMAGLNSPVPPPHKAKEPALPFHHPASQPRTPSAFSRQTASQTTVTHIAQTKYNDPTLAISSARSQTSPRTANASIGPSGAHDGLGLSIGWEDRCWQELARLKEEMFWRRIAAVGSGVITQNSA